MSVRARSVLLAACCDVAIVPRSDGCGEVSQAQRHESVALCTIVRRGLIMNYAHVDGRE
jgi:hypothetical protein